MDIGSGPVDKGGRASESAFAGLSGAAGPSALLSPQPDQEFTQLGPGEHQVIS